MKPEIYVFIPPNLKHNLPNDGIKHCCLGWQAENDVLLCPRKRPKCHIFCLQVLSEDVSPNLGEALLDEAKRCGAVEIFIDCEKASDNLSETCQDLSSRGIRVFSSADLKGDCLHVTHWGRHRILTPKCRKTVLAENSKPRKTDISRSELKSLIHRYSPKENYSR
ncbi:MAG: hypothetical protein IKZ19_05890, partial [Clostridia bacterium]|nr:hypothetical protein [Clostridia bacterium]